MLLTRRGLITGLVSLVAAPAIVRASSLMPVKAWVDAQPMTSFEIFRHQQAWREAMLDAMRQMVDPPLIVDGDKVIGNVPVHFDMNRELFLKARRS
jgi:hypothetical protein